MGKKMAREWRKIETNQLKYFFKWCKIGKFKTK